MAINSSIIRLFLWVKQSFDPVEFRMVDVRVDYLLL